MTTLITRLYANGDVASDASAALLGRGLSEDAIHTVGPKTTDKSAAMAEAGLSEEAAAAYSAKMSGTNTLLAVRAPFGMAGNAVAALKRFEAVDVEVDDLVHVPASGSGSLRDSIIPGNRKFLTGENALSTGARYSPEPHVSARQKGKAKVSHSTITSKNRQSLIKKPKPAKSVLRGNPTPFSKLLGLSLIKKPKDRLSVARDNPTPFSSAFGWPTVVDPATGDAVQPPNVASESRVSSGTGSRP